MEHAIIILAAGRGERMNSETPKVMHKIAGAPMIMHTLRTAKSLDPDRIIVITGYGAEQVEKEISELEPEIDFVRQIEQKGTGHAVKCAEKMLKNFTGNTLILYGDVPFISPDTLELLIEEKESGTDLVVLGFESKQPGNYGRLIIENDQLISIVEAKDATTEQLKITLCNSGVLYTENKILFQLLSNITNENANQEYYLTDIVETAKNQNLSIKVVCCDELETLGINTRSELTNAELTFQIRARERIIENGVTLSQPDTTYFSFDTEIGREACIGPNVVFGPGVTIESGAEILPFCHLEGCHISKGAKIGPFARLRPGTELSEDVKVGNFVEIKNSTISTKSKINHLSYIGDTTIGENSNIGAGTITCNYDGISKHTTEIGNDVFIGSNTLLVAPVSVGDNSMTASGTIVTESIPSGNLAIGRVKQVNKPGYVKKLVALLKSKKKSKDN
jgi:bifunctional UDP-N-acetylglucosamine pyrophosphorylase/glucosamine-1-phosphate N-acetyltransferase